MTEMLPTEICEQWTLLLPEHRANRGTYPEGTPHAGEPVWKWWERERLESMHALLKPGDLVVDVGAEEGDLSALYASWGCKVFLAEPNPRVWPNIRAIFEANGFIHSAWWVGFLADHSNGAEEKRQQEGDGWWPECALGEIIGDHGFLNLAENDNPERVTPTITLDRLIFQDPIDAITIDVEGAELRVLRGAVETIKRDRPLLWVSVHPEFMAEMYGNTEQELADLLIGLDYGGQWLADVHEEHWLWFPNERAGEFMG